MIISNAIKKLLQYFKENNETIIMTITKYLHFVFQAYAVDGIAICDVHYPTFLLQKTKLLLCCLYILIQITFAVLEDEDKIQYCWFKA